ncbi:hypothetical protein HID58_019489, partial [Brassica napus]
MLMENIARLVLIIIKLKGVRMDDKGNVYVADFEPSHNWRFRCHYYSWRDYAQFCALEERSRRHHRQNQRQQHQI